MEAEAVAKDAELAKLLEQLHQVTAVTAVTAVSAVLAHVCACWLMLAPSWMNFARNGTKLVKFAATRPLLAPKTSKIQ